MSVGMAALVSSLPRLSVRSRGAEIMDDPALDPARHLNALDALERVNRLSLTSMRVWREVVALARSGVRPVKVLDVACGGGDVLVDLGVRARRAGVAVELHGCDRSAVALERAHRRAGEACRFHERDVIAHGLSGTYDIVTSSLFLHHLSEASATGLLRAMGGAADRILLVQDLRRTLTGYMMAWVGLHTLTGSDVARTDGLISVRAAFTVGEVVELARAAGLVGARVHRCWPQRFILRWRRA